MDTIQPAFKYGGTLPRAYKFTGKERDTESGLDNFGKRYHASSLGRFMSVDPHDIVSDARNPKKFRTDLLDPQNWNRYAYVTNNPLKFADWEGLEKYLVVYVQQPVPGSATRAVTNLLFSGTLAKFSDIRFVFPHAGGSVPMMVVRMHQYAAKNSNEKVPNGIEFELRKLHYDIAGTAYPPAIAALTRLIPTTQILFGSDNPFIALAETAEGMTQLGFSKDDVQRIGRDNALALLPRLKVPV